MEQTSLARGTTICLPTSPRPSFTNCWKTIPWPPSVREIHNVSMTPWPQETWGLDCILGCSWEDTRKWTTPSVSGVRPKEAFSELGGRWGALSYKFFNLQGILKSIFNFQSNSQNVWFPVSFANHCFWPCPNVILPSFNIPSVWGIRQARQLLGWHFWLCLEVALFIIFPSLIVDVMSLTHSHGCCCLSTSPICRLLYLFWKYKENTKS